MTFTRRALAHPSEDQILTALRALRRASIKDLCCALWPELPWLPILPGQDAARGTCFRWRHDPPLPDGRRASTETAAAWLYGRCEALVQRGLLLRAAAGQHRTVDLIGHSAYAPAEPPAADHGLARSPAAGLPCAAGPTLVETPCAPAPCRTRRTPGPAPASSTLTRPSSR